MPKLIPLAERLQEAPEARKTESLKIFSQRMAVYHQGVAALTKMRCHRENMDCWPRWEKGHYEEQYKGMGHAPSPRDFKFNFWFHWGGLDILYENEIGQFKNLVLEPMYWLEECANAQEGV